MELKVGKILLSVIKIVSSNRTFMELKEAYVSVFTNFFLKF